MFTNNTKVKLVTKTIIFRTIFYQKPRKLIKWTKKFTFRYYQT